MKTKHFLLCTTLLITLSVTALCDKTQTAAKLKFPDLFKMDDYYKCPEDSTFCTASLKLVPHDVKSEFWREIEDWSKERHHFNRTVIYRTICIPKSFQEKKRQFFENKANEELTLYNASSKMYDIRCMEPRRFDVNIKLYMTILVGYLTLVLIATIYDVAIYDQRSQSKLEKLLVCFSATNFMKTSITKTKDYQRLKGIQGIRTYQAILVISGHTLMTFLQKNIRNPEYVEYLLGFTFMEYLLIFAMDVIQIFFFISMWLLTAQILVMHKENGKFTIKDGCLILMHRIARIWPLLTVMIFFGIPLFKYYGYGPGNFQIVTIMNQACNDNWWISFLFATDLIETEKVCHIGLWSLTIDVQLYVMTIIFLYVVLKHNLNIKKSIAALFLVCYLMSAIQIYSKELFRDSWINIKVLTNMNIFTDKKLSDVYFGFWTNTCSGVIGILFGYLYFSTRENPEKPEPFEKYYKAILILLPMVSMLAANRDYSKFTAALIGPLFKPLFSLGIAVGIYGRSRKVIKGLAKFLCENKYVGRIGNFSFSTYIFHFFIAFTTAAWSSSTIEFSLLKSLVEIVKNVILSFAIGIIATITIELPGVYLKKLILPPVMKKTRTENQVELNNHSKNKVN